MPATLRSSRVTLPEVISAPGKTVSYLVSTLTNKHIPCTIKGKSEKESVGIICQDGPFSVDPKQIILRVE